MSSHCTYQHGREWKCFRAAEHDGVHWNFAHDEFFDDEGHWYSFEDRETDLQRWNAA